jgi:hypothetical protein
MAALLLLRMCRPPLSRQRRACRMPQAVNTSHQCWFGFLRSRLRGRYGCAVIMAWGRNEVSNIDQFPWQILGLRHLGTGRQIQVARFARCRLNAEDGILTLLAFDDTTAPAFSRSPHLVSDRFCQWSFFTLHLKSASNIALKGTCAGLPQPLARAIAAQVVQSSP